MNKITEKTRTASARKVLAENRYREKLQGFKSLTDGKIAILNDYMLYIGNHITGIESVKQPRLYPDVTRLIPEYRKSETCMPLDLTEIKQRYKEAKQEYKGCRNLKQKTSKAFLELKNNKGEYVYFDSELLIHACNMVCGENYSICFHGCKNGCVITCAENENMCIVMPFLPGDRWNQNK